MRTTCDPAFREVCGAWKDPQTDCPCGWSPLTPVARLHLQQAHAELHAARARRDEHPEIEETP